MVDRISILTLQLVILQGISKIVHGSPSPHYRGLVGQVSIASAAVSLMIEERDNDNLCESV